MVWMISVPLVGWGVAAYSPDRPIEITNAIHEYTTLLFVTCCQFFTFLFIPLVVISLTTNGKNSPFPRWYGYFSFWAWLIMEAGALPFLFKGGPFAWDGLVPFWIPVGVFVTWFFTTLSMLRKAILRQRDEDPETEQFESSMVSMGRA